MWKRIKKKLAGWKTVIWNVFLAVIPSVAVALQQLGAIDWSQHVGPFGAIAIGFLVGAVGVWLRYITIGPVPRRPSHQPAPDVKAGD